MAVTDVVCPVLVARDEQVSILEDALLAALRGNGGVVLLGGDAGMGKSRLARELSDRARRLGCTVMMGACSEAELSLAYLPFLEAVGNHLALVDVGSLRERLGTSAEELAHLFPQLGRPSPAGDDPMHAKLRLFEGLLAVLRDAAAQRGLLLVLEDVHWAEPATRELLDYLTRRLRTMPVLVLATFRTDELHRRHPLLPTLQAWRRSGQASVVELSPLTPAGVAQMVRAMFDEEEVSDEFRDFLHERTEGNPFVVEETLRDARDRGHIFRTAAGWDRADIAELRLRMPQTVRDTILLRLERLDEGEVEVLSAASVIGRASDLSLLSAVTGRDSDIVLAALQACVNQQLLEEEDHARGTFRFRHALTREAVYEDMVVPRRQQLHRRVAAALRNIPGQPAIDLANHLLLAGSYEEAVDMCVAAAEEALASHAYRDAAALFERAAPHVQDPVARARLLVRAAESHTTITEPVAARRAVEAAIPLLEEAGQTLEAASARALLGRCHWELQRTDLAREEYQRARSALEELGPSGPLAVVHIRLSGLASFNGEFEDALRHAREAQRIALESNATRAAAWSLNFISVAEAHLGRLTDAAVHMEESFRASMEGDHRFQAINALFNGCWEAVHLALAGDSRTWLDRIPAISGAADQIWSPYLAGLVGLHSGEVPAAIDLARDALRGSVDAGMGKSVWRSSVLLAQALAEADLGTEAAAELPPPASRVDLQDSTYDGAARIRVRLAQADRAGALAEARGIDPRACDLGSPAEVIAEVGAADPGWLAELLSQVAWSDEVSPLPRPQVARGWLALAEQRGDDARVHFERGIEGFRRAGFRLDAWHAGRGLARALAATGQRDAAAGLLSEVVSQATGAGALLAARLAHETATELGLAPAPLEARPPAAAESEGAVGERLVTVLFADVRGYTALSGASTPADLVDRVGSLQRWAAQEVARHRGIVDKFAGDAVMATFNVSGASVDHATEALQAGLAIRDKASLLGMPVGIGIATGPAVVGRLAPGANVSVLGETTNLASRLQSAAGSNEIVVSGETFRRVRDWLTAHGLATSEERLTLKGLEGPQPAHRLPDPSVAPKR